MVCSSLGNVIGADALDQALLLVSHAVAVGVLVQGEEGRMQYPEFAVVVNQSARMIHLGEGVHLVRFAITVGINAAYYATTAFFFTKTPLLIDANKHFAGRGGCKADGVINFRRCSKEIHLKPFRCLHPVHTIYGVVTAILGSLHHLARQFGQGAGMGLKFPQAAPHVSARSVEGDFEKLCALRINLVGCDLFDVLVLRLIDNLLPVLAIGRSLDGVTIGGVVFLPEDADILNVRRFLELNL